MNRTDAELLRLLEESLGENFQRPLDPAISDHPFTWLERSALELALADLMARWGSCGWETLDTEVTIGIGSQRGVLPEAWRQFGAAVELAPRLMAKVVLVRSERSVEVRVSHEDVKAWVAGERKRSDGITLRINRGTRRPIDVSE